MSAPKFQLELSKRAENDFRNIVNYTMTTWGERQLIIYRDKINKALEAITENPHKGKLMDADIRKMAVEKHKIFYRINGNILLVIRIFHERMDEGAHVCM